MKVFGNRIFMRKFLRRTLQGNAMNPVLFRLILDSLDYFRMSRQCSMLFRYLQRVLHEIDWSYTVLSPRGRVISGMSAKAVKIGCSNLDAFLAVTQEEINDNDLPTLRVSQFMLKLELDEIEEAKDMAISAMNDYPQDEDIIRLSNIVFALAQDEELLFNCLEKALNCEGIMKTEKSVRVLLSALLEYISLSKDYQPKTLEMMERIGHRLRELVIGDESSHAKSVSELVDKLFELKEKVVKEPSEA